MDEQTISSRQSLTLEQIKYDQCSTIIGLKGDKESVDSGSKYLKGVVPCRNGLISLLYQCVLLSALGSFQFGYNISVFNTAKSFVIVCFGFCEGESNTLTCSKGTLYGTLINTGIFVGATVGALWAGSVVQHGRRQAAILNHLFYLGGCILSVFSEGFYTLLIARLVVGVAVGLSTMISPMLISEFSPRNKRGKLGVIHQLFITIGLLIGVLSGLALGAAPTGDPDEIVSKFSLFWWRIMFGIPIIVSTFALILYTFIYKFETPLYEIEKGHNLYGYKLLWVFNDGKGETPRTLPEKTNSSLAACEYRSALEVIDDREKSKAMQLGIWQILANKIYAKILLVGVVLAVGQQLSGINVLMSNSNSLYLSIGLSSDTITIITVCLMIFNVIVTLPAMFIIESIGRVPLLIAGNIGQGIFLITAAIANFINPNSIVVKYISMGSTFGYLACFAVAFGPVLWVYLHECFPAHISSTAAAVASASSWASAAILVLSSDYIMAIDTKYIFLVFGASSLILSVYVFFFVKETKGRGVDDCPYLVKNYNSNKA